MYGRRSSPYSRIDQIERSRGEVISLIVVAILLAGIVNLGTNFFYALIEELTSLLPPRPALMIMVLGLAFCSGLAVVIFLAFVTRLSRHQTQMVRLDVLVPYGRRKGQKVDVIEQHPYRPQYQVVHRVFHLWRARWAANPEGLQLLTQAWESALFPPGDAPRKPVQSVLFEEHLAVIEALLLVALHGYAERSLEPGLAFVYPWAARLNARRLRYEELPEFWRENPYVRDGFGKDLDSWRFLVPAGLRIERQGDDERRTIYLRLPSQGQVTLNYYTHPWVSAERAQPIQVLGDGVLRKADSLLDAKRYYVFGTRLEIQASFENALMKHHDAFCEWSAGLLSNLEEALDWRYFLSTRTDRIVSDLPWKIGDMPAMASIWGKLKDIEQKVEPPR